MAHLTISRCSHPFEVDLWALGCVVYVMLSGNMPFFGPECRSNIMTGTYSLEGSEWEQISSEAKSCVRRLMDVNPKMRLSACDVHEHAWLQSHAQPQLPAKAMRLHFQTLKRYHKQNKFRHVAGWIKTLSLQGEETYIRRVGDKIEQGHVSSNNLGLTF